MKRFTIVLACGCSVTLWAERNELKEAGTKCEDHHDEKGWALQGLAEWRSGLEGKLIHHVSIEPKAPSDEAILSAIAEANAKRKERLARHSSPRPRRD